MYLYILTHISYIFASPPLGLACLDSILWDGEGTARDKDGSKIYREEEVREVCYQTEMTNEVGAEGRGMELGLGGGHQNLKGLGAYHAPRWCGPTLGVRGLGTHRPGTTSQAEY